MLVGVTVLSLCVFGAIAYEVASSKGFEIRTPVPSFLSRNFPRHICLEGVILNTKLTVIGEYKKEQRR